jgi:hypothetical protein
MESASEIVIGASGNVWVAPTTATGPDDVGTAMDSSEWTELGFLSEAGATFTDAKTMFEVLVWQSFYPARRAISGRDSTIAFVLRQWNGATVAFAFGGGEIGSGGGEYSYTPPVASIIDERSLVLEWADDDKHYRLYMPRGIVTEAVTTNIVRTAAADLPITFGVITDGTVDPYILYTDDSAFAHVSGS